jgi:FtsH-binding integral membrane protein
MERMLVVVFDNEEKALDASRALEILNEESVIALDAEAVVTKDLSGATTIVTSHHLDRKEQWGERPSESHRLLGGPVGLAVGTAAGSRLGGDGREDEWTVVVHDVARTLRQGRGGRSTKDTGCRCPHQPLGGTVCAAICRMADTHARKVSAFDADLRVKAEYSARRADTASSKPAGFTTKAEKRSTGSCDEIRDPNVIGGLSMPYGTVAPRHRMNAADRRPFSVRLCAWMCAGLLITATPGSSRVLIMSVPSRSGFLFWGLVVAQFATVFVLSARAATRRGNVLLFIFYAALTGVTLSFALLAFTGESLATTFVVTAGMFAGLAMYGTVTKRSLGGIGQFLFMGLLGLVLASIVGLFWHSSAFQFVLSFIGVLVFRDSSPTTRSG